MPKHNPKNTTIRVGAQDDDSESSSPVTPASISVASVSSNSLRISSETLEQLEQLKQAGFRVPTDPQPEEVILDLGDPTTTGRDKLTSAEQEELRQLQQAWELRLQKIFQHDKYQTGSGQEHIDDNFLASLLVSHQKEHAHFITAPFARKTERGQGKNDGKYTDEKLTDFDASGIVLNKAIQPATNTDTNNFTIPYSVKLRSRTHTSNVSVAYEADEATKKIVISGKQDNIIIMLHTALKAQEKLGNNAKFSIYPSSDITAVAELLARCKVYGLNPEFKARPGQSHEAFQEFLVNTNKDNFQQLVADFKTQYAIKEDYKPNPAYTPKSATTPSTPTSPQSPVPPETTPPLASTVNPLLALNKRQRPHSR